MTRTFLRSALFALLAVTRMGVAQEMPPATKSNVPFDQLKSLTGAWGGKKSHDVPVKLVYEVVANGSGLMERMQPGREAEMITMYSLNGDRLVVTQYCSVGNQPTMQSTPLVQASDNYNFHFVRVAGTKTPEEGHMVALSLTIPDKDHLRQVWTFEDHGRRSSETFLYTRNSDRQSS